MNKSEIDIKNSDQYKDQLFFMKASKESLANLSAFAHLIIKSPLSNENKIEALSKLYNFGGIDE